MTEQCCVWCCQPAPNPTVIRYQGQSLIYHAQCWQEFNKPSVKGGCVVYGGGDAS